MYSWTVSMLVNIPCPIILALSINSSRSKKAGKAVQMLTYAPYFISTVIVVSLIIQLCDVRSGLFNILRDIMSDAQTQANMVQATGKMSSSAVLAMTESLKYTTILCASVPMLVIYSIVQKYFAKGVMIGSVKG